MLNEIEEIKTKNLLEFVQRILWQQWKKDNKWYWFLSGEEKTASLLVYEDNSRWYWDYSKQWWWTIIDFYMNFYNCDQKIAIKNLKQIYKIESEKKEFVKQPKREEIVNNFEKYKLNWLTPLIRLLHLRWFTHEQVIEFSENIKEISKSLAFYEWLWIKEKIYKDTLIFPCYNENKNIIGGKLRTLDWTQFLTKNWDKKSLTVNKSWFIYDEIHEDEVIITEWEIDYLTLKVLGFKSVIWNLWWASFWRNLKILCKNTKKIICFYDNDWAWQQAIVNLQKALNRPLRIIKFPSFDWKIIKDVNDLFLVWYWYKEFKDLIENWEFIESQKEESNKEKYKISKQNNWYYFEKQLKNNVINLRITDFFIEIIDCLENQTPYWLERSLILEIKHSSWKIKEIFSNKDTCDVLSFKRKIKKINPFCNLFELKSEQLDELFRFLLQNTKAIYTVIVNKKGFIPEYNCWTFQEWVIFEQKFYEFDENKIVNLWNVKIKLQTEDKKYLPKYQENNQDIKNDIIAHFQHMFWWINGDLVLWYLIATLFINSIDFIAFPILFIFWKKWSWKTTAIENALKILWIENSKNVAESDSIFVDQTNSSLISSLPYWSDEYKNWKKSKEKETFYKTLFDRSWVSRWQITDNGLWINTINFISSLILSWEQTPNDDAVFSRTCLIDVSKNREWDLFDEIQEKSKYYPNIIKTLLIDNDFWELVKKYKKWLESVKKILKSKWVKDRLLDVYSPIIAWFLLFEDIFLWKNEVKGDWINEIINKIIDKREKESEDILDNFFNKIFFLFTKWYIIWWYEEHIRYNNSTHLMNINFSYLYTLYEDNNKENLISKKDLKDYLEKQYWAKRSTMDKNISTELQIWKWNNTLSFIIEKDKYPKIFDDYFNINF